MGRQVAGNHLVAREVPAAPLGARWARMFAGLSARLRGRSLDRAISAGADLTSTAVLARRAAWLTSRGHRRRLARSLRGLLEPTTGRREIDEPVYARGVVMAGHLLTEGDSHLYVPERAGQLRDEVEAIVDALEGREDTW